MNTMKKTNGLLFFSICLIASILMFLNTELIAYAVEDITGDVVEEVSYDSVVEVDSYSIEEGFIEAGKEANVILTVKNDNKHTVARRVVVVVSSNSGMVYPTYGNDNLFFVGNIEPNASTTISVPIVVNSAFKGDYADLICSISYYINGAQINNSSTMILPAKNNNTIVVNSLDVSANATLNGKSLLSINYYNKSSENINDAVLVVNGNVNDPSKTIELGTISAGKSYTKDCNVVFTQTGEQSVSIQIRYSDYNGEQVETDLGTFNVTVNEEDRSGAVDVGGNAALISIGRAIALLAFAAAVFVVWKYIKKR